MSIYGQDECIQIVDILGECSIKNTYLHIWKNFCVIFITYISFVKDKLAYY